LVLELMLALAEVSDFSDVPDGGVTFTEVDELELGVVLSAGGLMLVVVLLATGGGVVVLGTTTVVSFDAVVGDGVVVDVVVVRSHAASDTPRVSAATRGISFMCSPYGSVEAIC
jgi:hypothetical protein